MPHQYGVTISTRKVSDLEGPSLKDLTTNSPRWRVPCTQKQATDSNCGQISQVYLWDPDKHPYLGNKTHITLINNKLYKILFRNDKSLQENISNAKIISNISLIYMYTAEINNWLGELQIQSPADYQFHACQMSGCLSICIATYKLSSQKSPIIITRDTMLYQRLNSSAVWTKTITSHEYRTFLHDLHKNSWSLTYTYDHELFRPQWTSKTAGLNKMPKLLIYILNTLWKLFRCVAWCNCVSGVGLYCQY